MHADDSTSTSNRALVFIGGDPPRPGAITSLELAADLVVAVDSGLHTADALGVRVDHVVGDMDSVRADALAAAGAAGAEIHVHPTDKDATDLELALDLVVALLAPAPLAPTDLGPAPPTAAPPAVHVLGGGGGRLDHLIGDLLLLSAARLAAWDVTAHFGSAAITVVRPGRTATIAGTPGEYVSLLPFHGDVRGVRTEGLRWPLVDGHLAAGTSRAVSNELASPIATVSTTEGVLVVIRPGTHGDPVPPRPGPYDPSPQPPSNNNNHHHHQEPPT